MDIPRQMVIQIPKDGEASVMEPVAEEQDADDEDWRKGHTQLYSRMGHPVFSNV